jgi:ABC-2 type transport system ATP-binding protein
MPRLFASSPAPVPPDDPAALRLRGVRCHAGRRELLAGVDLEVPRGAICGVLGANGAGKSTLLRVALGLMPFSAGTVQVQGWSVPMHHAEALGSIGWVPDRLLAPPHLTLDGLACAERRFHPRWRSDVVTELSARFALPRDVPLHRLSKGQATAAQLVLALARCPSLLLLDEPTDGVDPVLRRELIAALLEYAVATDATIVLTAHRPDEVERLCDTIVVLDAGRTVAAGPLHAFRESFRLLRVRGGAEAPVGAAPFTVLSRAPLVGQVEEWMVRDWAPGHVAWCAGHGVEVHEVVRVTLDDAVVELLQRARRVAA